MNTTKQVRTHHHDIIGKKIIVMLVIAVVFSGMGWLVFKGIKASRGAVEQGEKSLLIPLRLQK